MPAITPTSTRRTAPARRRRSRSIPASAPHRQAAAAAPVTPTANAHRYGACEDRALYQCHCGCDFHAAVSTTVGCPACGAAQDW